MQYSLLHTYTYIELLLQSEKTTTIKTDESREERWNIYTDAHWTRQKKETTTNNNETRKGERNKRSNVKSALFGWGNSAIPIGLEACADGRRELKWELKCNGRIAPTQHQIQIKSKYIRHFILMSKIYSGRPNTFIYNIINNFIRHTYTHAPFTDSNEGDTGLGKHSLGSCAPPLDSLLCVYKTGFPYHTDHHAARPGCDKYVSLMLCNCVSSPNVCSQMRASARQLAIADACVLSLAKLRTAIRQTSWFSFFDWSPKRASIFKLANTWESSHLASRFVYLFGLNSFYCEHSCVECLCSGWTHGKYKL